MNTQATPTYTPAQIAKNRARWVAALRSGNYLQGQDRLANVDSETGGVRYCCLGVACEVLGVLKQSAKYTHGLRYGVSKEATVLPTEACAALGLRGYLVPYQGESESLTSLNDEEKLTFSQIADIIEAQPPGWDGM